MILFNGKLCFSNGKDMDQMIQNRKGWVFFSVRRIDFELILKEILNLDLWRIIEESKWALPRGGGKWDAVFRVR